MSPPHGHQRMDEIGPTEIAPELGHQLAAGAGLGAADRKIASGRRLQISGDRNRRWRNHRP